MIQIFQKKHKLGIGPPLDKNEGMLYTIHQNNEPSNFRRVWKSDEEMDNIHSIIGFLSVTTPESFAGVKPIGCGDVIAVDGVAHLICENEVLQIDWMDFPTDEIKPLPKLNYDYRTSYRNKAAMPDELLYLADSLKIPYGYLGSADYHGSHKGERCFESTPDDEYSTAFLHPDFCEGDEAVEYVKKLATLAGMEYLEVILPEMADDAPVLLADLDAAIEQCQQIAHDMADQNLEKVIGIMGDLKSIPEDKTQALAEMMLAHGITSEKLAGLKGMEFAEFTEKVTALLPKCDTDCFEKWELFSRELPVPDLGQTREIVLGELYGALADVKREFGEDIATEVFDFALQEEFCFRPDEMMEAAEMLLDDVPYNDITQKFLDKDSDLDPLEPDTAQNIEM